MEVLRIAKALVFSTAIATGLNGCQSQEEPVRGIFSSRTSHQIFGDYELSIHSRIKFAHDQYMEIRSYRVKFNDGTSATDIDIGIMTLGGELSQNNGQLTVDLKQVKMEMDADLYRQYVFGPRSELAMVDVPALLRQRQLKLSVLQYDGDSLCIGRIGGHPQCYVLSQVIGV